MLFPDWVYRSFTRKRCCDNVLLLVFGLKNHVDLNLFFLLLFAEWKFYKPPLSWISIWRHQMSIRQMEPSCLLFNSQQSTRQLVTDSQVFRPVKLFSDETGGAGRRVYVDDWRMVVTGCQLLLLGLHSSICWQQPPPTHGSDGNVSHPYILKARFCGFRNPQIILNLNEVLKSTKAPNLWLTSSWFQIFWHC